MDMSESDNTKSDSYADWRFVAVRRMDDGSYHLSATLTREDATERAQRDVQQWGAVESTVCEVITTFERRYLSVEVAPRSGMGGQMIGVTKG